MLSATQQMALLIIAGGLLAGTFLVVVSELQEGDWREAVAENWHLDEFNE